MIKAALQRVVDRSTRHAIAVAILFAVVGTAAAIHGIRHFAISTDTERLMPRSLPWRAHQIAYQAKFPPDRLLAIVTGPTPEAADAAAAALLASLRAIGTPDGPVRGARPLGFGRFFQANALMLAPVTDAARLAQRITVSRPLLATVAADPSLAGLARALGAAGEAARAGQLPPDAIGQLLPDAAASLATDGRAAFSPIEAFAAAPAGPGATRRVIAVDPVLDYRALQPGRPATDRIRARWAALPASDRDGAALALTGEVPVNDEQFGAVQHGQTLGLGVTAVAVVLIFWLALRSFRIILAVGLSLACGFAITCSVALLAVGSFNLISIAFAILFVGLGADFGIQFSVRYREERYRAGGHPDGLRIALRGTAAEAGVPLALAAISTTVGFFCFLPTDYRGVSELGLVAGMGMLIAFATTITLLPALLALLGSPDEAAPMGFAALAPLDRFLARHRIAVIVFTLGGVLCASPLLAFTRFDFDPTHMEIPTGEAVEALHALQHDPGSGVESLDVASADLAAADRLASRLRTLSTVSATHTASDLLTADPDRHRLIVARLRAAIGPVLDASGPAGPSRDQPVRDQATRDQALREALRTAAASLDAAARAARPPQGAAALAVAFRRLAAGSAAERVRADAILLPPIRADLARLRLMLDGEPVTLATLPPVTRREWIAPDGSARVEILPRGDTQANPALARFARDVLRVAPTATGNPATLIGWRGTVIRAFVEAGAYAVAAIALVLFLVLRRVRDVLLTLLPLLVAGILTLELAVVLGIRLNFANIIALPLLLGVGVAFKIYYVMAWRRGVTAFLQSPLTRAVLFSALTTGTAFGSLWLSPAPGTSSMGKLMALALLCTLSAAVLFQPALMGPPPGCGGRGKA